MAPWQGPALLAFNDAVFSPSDFHAISRIGQDSKLQRPAATGRSPGSPDPARLNIHGYYHLVLSQCLQSSRMGQTLEW
eukprot:scaffold665748_cov51-Prasinocladus_malaysianus.AAC.1